MVSSIKEIILRSYKNGLIQNNKDIMDLSVTYGVSFVEIFKLLCFEKAKGTPCESCINLGTSRCSACSRNKKDYHKEMEM